MRATIVADPVTLNIAYRGYQPAQALAARGHDVVLAEIDEDDLRPETIDGSDVVYVYRYQRKSTQRILREAQAAGAAIVWDNDDDLTSYPSRDVESRRKGALRSQQVAASTAAMVRLADLVTTTTPFLADGFRRQGAAQVRVVENFVAPEFAGAADGRARHAGVVVGWVAALEHLFDLRTLRLRATLQRLLDAHPDVHVESIGIELELERDRYRSHGFVWFRDLPATMARFDVGIAPLVEADFNRARSNIKVKEYAALGLPWLASPVGQYVGLGEQHGGRLVDDDRWYEELERLICSARDRRKLGKRAARWAKRERIEPNADRWVDVFEEAIRRRHAAGATEAAPA